MPEEPGAYKKLRTEGQYRVGAEPLGVPGVGVRSDAHRQDVQQFRIIRILAAFQQRADQSLGFATG